MLEVVIYITILKNIWLLWLEDIMQHMKHMYIPLKKTKTFSTYRQFARGNEKFFYEINNKRVSKSKYLKTLSPLEKSCKKVVSQPYYFL